jgi:hypothetical protein
MGLLIDKYEQNSIMPPCNLHKQQTTNDNTPHLLAAKTKA